MANREETTMKFSAIGLATCFALITTVSYAQTGQPSGQGSTKGDPAASSQNAKSRHNGDESQQKR
jgi:hypothetical protein